MTETTKDDTSPTPTADCEKALKALDLLQKRAYSHADKSNGPKEMREWIDSDAETIRRAILSTSEKGWRPIETAPKDGTNILLWWPAQFHCALTGHWAEKYNPWIGWKVSGWYHDKFDSLPTHWQPLPAAPVSMTDEGGE